MVMCVHRVMLRVNYVHTVIANAKTGGIIKVQSRLMDQATATCTLKQSTVRLTIEKIVKFELY